MSFIYECLVANSSFVRVEGKVILPSKLTWLKWRLFSNYFQLYKMRIPLTLDGGLAAAAADSVVANLLLLLTRGDKCLVE